MGSGCVQGRTVPTLRRRDSIWVDGLTLVLSAARAPCLHSSLTPGDQTVILHYLCPTAAYLPVLPAVC